MLKIGDSVGAIYRFEKDGNTEYKLVIDEITKIIQTKTGVKYHTKSKFRPLIAEDVNYNTELFHDLEFVFVSEVFGLTELNKKKAEEWVEWANGGVSRVNNALSSD